MHTDLQSTYWVTRSEFVCELKNKRRRKRVGQEERCVPQHRKYTFSDKVAGAESGVKLSWWDDDLFSQPQAQIQYEGHMLLQMDVQDQRSDIPANLICSWNYSWFGEWGCNQIRDTGFIVSILITFVILVFQNSPCLFVQFVRIKDSEKSVPSSLIQHCSAASL